MTDFISSLVLISILVIAGILHMLVVKFACFDFLTIPIWEKGFGRNKTWRGLLVLPVASLIGTCLVIYGLKLSKFDMTPDISEVSTLGLGLTLGLFYALFELPNSFLKRKCNVTPGKLASSQGQRILFFVLDHFDSLIGCLLVYFFFFGWHTSLTLSLFIGPLIHTLVNVILWLGRVRKEPF